jgi:pSer/pThr/pTyr-binding forkhead associated (FHA) protein
MRITLIVLSEGKVKGKEISVGSFPFLIGRDPQCQLRPASALVSKRHCAILVRDNKVFVHDFQSTNGTFVNGRQIMGDIEIRNEDQLTIGPLNFSVRLETLPPVNRPTPPPPSKLKSEKTHDEEAAALLLSGLSEGTAPPEEQPTDSSGVPTGSTIDMEVPPAGTKPADKAEPPKKTTKEGDVDTSKSAAAILEKYRRRPRQ